MNLWNARGGVAALMALTLGGLGGLDDQVIHIGMNKVVSGTSRVGTGLTAVEIYRW